MRRVPLGDLTLPIDKSGPSPAKTHFTYVDLSAVNNISKTIDGESITRIEAAPSRARQIICSDDVIVSTVRPNLNAVALVPPRLSGAIASTGFCVLRARSGLFPRYLFHWVRCERFIEEMVKSATGASYPAVTESIVKASRIPLPPIEEQRRIAAILDRTDALHLRREAASMKLDLVRKSIFEEMFPTGSFEEATVGEIAECLDAQRMPVAAGLRPPGNVPYYGANGQQGWIDRPLFNEPLVLVAEDGGRFDEPERGVAYKISGPSWVNNHAHVLRPGSRVNVDYLHQALRHYDFTSLITGSTRSKLNQKQLKSAPIQIPPLGLQVEFASRLNEIEKIATRFNISLARIGNLRQGLQAQAFSGGL